MLVCMGDRGPDSAGLAVFSNRWGRLEALQLYCRHGSGRLVDGSDAARRDLDPDANLRRVKPCHSHSRHANRGTAPRLAGRQLSSSAFAVGRPIDRPVQGHGTPAEISERYRFPELAGSHAVGHTRMATESAVTPAHAHPFTAGEDFCLVHNGSLSNPYSIRRKLERRGIRFETDNDTEAACRFLEWRMSEGDPLEAALRTGDCRAGRVLHAVDGDGREAGAGPRRVRLQAGGGGRDGRLRRHRFRVPFPRPFAGSERSPHIRTRPGTDLFMERSSRCPA